MTFRQSDIKRAVAAVKSAECTVSGVEICPDGSIRVLVGEPVKMDDRPPSLVEMRRKRRAGQPQGRAPGQKETL